MIQVIIIAIIAIFALIVLCKCFGSIKDKIVQGGIIEIFNTSKRVFLRASENHAKHLKELLRFNAVNYFYSVQYRDNIGWLIELNHDVYLVQWDFTPERAYNNVDLFRTVNSADGKQTKLINFKRRGIGGTPNYNTSFWCSVVYFKNPNNEDMNRYVKHFKLQCWNDFDGGQFYILGAVCVNQALTEEFNRPPAKALDMTLANEFDKIIKYDNCVVNHDPNNPDVITSIRVPIGTQPNDFSAFQRYQMNVNVNRFPTQGIIALYTFGSAAEYTKTHDNSPWSLNSKFANQDIIRQVKY